MSNKNSTGGSKQEESKYGILTMLAMIVGIVIGSGIYVVNDQLYDTSNSIGLSMIAWIIVSIIVLFMLISFIEISSMTAKTGESGTINNWSRKLLGPGFSKFAGFFFPLIYFPILLTGFSLYISGEILGNFYVDDIYNAGAAWGYFALSTVIALMFITSIFMMNAFTSKPGKIFQQTGTVIKLIPLFTLILIGFLALVGAFIPTDVDGANVSGNAIFDFSNDANNIKEGSSILLLILLMAPMVMFSFDGFLFAASLQNEAKKSSTYKVSAILGIIIIILTYVMMSAIAFTYGDPGTIGADGEVTGSEYNVAAVFARMTGLQWIGIVVSIMIIISMATGLSGNSISQNRMLADLSAHNQIKDADGSLVARNKNLVPQKSGLITMFVTLFAFTIFRSADAITLIAFSFEDTSLTGISYNDAAISFWALNFLTVISYSIYTAIIFGGVKNRFTNEVDVDKNKAFLPSAIISLIAISIIVVVFSGSVFIPGDLQESGFLITTYVVEMLMAIGVILGLILIPIYFTNKAEQLTAEELAKKEELIKIYRENKPDPRYK